MGDSQATEDLHPEEEVEIHFKPIVQLEKVEISTHEDDEDEVFKIRAKLFRFDHSDDTPQWKERGTGDIRILKHKVTLTVRLVMRREKTFKLCCNHYLTKSMALKPHANSDKSFVWSTMADYVDDEPKHELLAIRFRNSEDAEKFKTKFEECREDLPASSAPTTPAKGKKADSTTTNDDKENKDVVTSTEKDDEDKVLQKMTSLSVSEDNSKSMSAGGDSNDTK